MFIIKILVSRVTVFFYPRRIHFGCSVNALLNRPKKIFFSQNDKHHPCNPIDRLSHWKMLVYLHARIFSPRGSSILIEQVELVCAK